MIWNRNWTHGAFVNPIGSGRRPVAVCYDDQGRVAHCAVTSGWERTWEWQAA